MNKTEFLNELEKRIRVLEKNEIKDILSEYSQHIDMRMESGLSEADAIKDFGNMDDLAAEILEAYHVNPEYEKNEDTVTDTAENKKDLKGLWTAFMGICASAAGGIKSFFKAGGRLIKKIVLKIWSLISLLWFKIKGLFGRKEKPVQSETEQIINETDINENTDIKKSDKHKKIGKAKGRCRKMISGFLFICLAIIVILCLIPVTIGGLISVFGLGASIVLMVQGYPVLGIFIICLGCSVMGVSLWLLLVSLIIKKKNINKIEEIREDDKETEENIEEYIIEDYTAKEDDEQ